MCPARLLKVSKTGGCSSSPMLSGVTVARGTSRRPRSAARTAARLVPDVMQRASGKRGSLQLSEHDQEQVGPMHIHRGVMVFFRNAAGHNLVDCYTQEDALRFVVFVDLLLAMVGKVTEQHRGDDGA